MPGRGLGTLTALEVLVIGGHGKVGLRLLRLLALDGHRSRGVTRKSVVTSLRHLVDTITSLAERGVGVRSLHEQADTTTPGGKLVVPVVAALAEFEHDLIRERTAAGLAAARARAATAADPRC
jgi:hypothetical protein